MSDAGYGPVFSDGAAEFLLQLPKRRQKKVVALIRQLAAHPHVRSDYSLPDESGREIELTFLPIGSTTPAVRFESQISTTLRRRANQSVQPMPGSVTPRAIE